MLTVARLCFLLTVCLPGCRDTESRRPPQEDALVIAPATYAVLSQKALTYQADFQLEAWAQLLAGDVEYHVPVGDSLWRLRGKEEVLAYWQTWKSRRRVREIHLSQFSIIPIRSSKALPLTDLPGVYVPVIYRRRITYVSGQVQERPVSLWLHFNQEKLIDRLYSFETQPDGAP